MSALSEAFATLLGSSVPSSAVQYAPNAALAEASAAAWFSASDLSVS